MASNRLAARGIELTARRVPFVRATVVRASVPTSAHPGDDAIVLPDGSIDGFVGGQCAENSVRIAALGALQDRQAVLLRVLPDGTEDFPDSPGAQVVVNPCLSGGALEIFLEPVLPPPLIEIVGRSPVADSVAAMAALLGYAAHRSPPGSLQNGTAALIVASHGQDEEACIRAALDAGVGYVALLASRKRGAAVLDSLALGEAERERVSTPAGLDIGARTAPEVALSILAEVVAWLRTPDTDHRVPVADTAGTAVDPVCGMTVVTTPAAHQLVVDGERVWFCGSQCRDRYAETVGQ